MIGTGKHAEFTNGLRVQGNGFTPDLVETSLTDRELRCVHGGAEKSKFRLTDHVQTRGSSCSSGSALLLLLLLLRDSARLPR